MLYSMTVAAETGISAMSAEKGCLYGWPWTGGCHKVLKWCVLAKDKRAGAVHDPVSWSQPGVQRSCPEGGWEAPHSSVSWWELFPCKWVQTKCMVGKTNFHDGLGSLTDSHSISLMQAQTRGHNPSEKKLWVTYSCFWLHQWGEWPTHDSQHRWDNLWRQWCSKNNISWGWWWSLVGY